MDVLAGPETADEPLPERPADPPALWTRAWQQLRLHETLLWWLHSAWALAIGAGVAWLGGRDFRLLRVAFWQLAFIWLTSLLLPKLVQGERLSPPMRAWLRLGVNYFQKNFYQQILFFALPVYWGSVTIGSTNLLFVILVAVSAVLSTFDVVYDRHLSVRRSLTALFLAFNLFAWANVALPVLWSISNADAMRVAAVVAVVAYATLRFHARDLLDRRVLALLGILCLGLFAGLEVGRGIVPPAPLRLASATFGTGIARTPPVVSGPLTALPAAWEGRVYAVTAIQAPLGLKDRLRHRWVVGGTTVYVSPYYTVTGGRSQGYRLWTSLMLRHLSGQRALRLDIETEGGQLVGRAELPVGAN